jgi:hypothetical protein
MVPHDADPDDHPALNQKKKPGEGAEYKKPARKKKISKSRIIPRPEDLPEEIHCSCPGWKKFLDRYSLIHSLQREDFPDQGVSFVYLAHFYRTKNQARESSLSQEEFEHFFKDIGYDYNYSGNFESRWFEGIGVKVS